MEILNIILWAAIVYLWSSIVYTWGYKKGKKCADIQCDNELNEAYHAGIERGKKMGQQVNLIVERQNQEQAKKATPKKKVAKKKNK